MRSTGVHARLGRLEFGRLVFGRCAGVRVLGDPAGAGVCFEVVRSFGVVTWNGDGAALPVGSVMNSVWSGWWPVVFREGCAGPWWRLACF